MAKRLEDYIPEKVYIGGKVVHIKHLTPSESSLSHKLGWFRPAFAEISIVVDFPCDQVLDTLLHELLHAIYYFCDIKDDDEEERTVTMMAGALQALFLQNPELITCIQKYNQATLKQ